MAYDPREDPRFLGSTIEIDEQIIDELSTLPRIADVLKMFDLEAWDEVAKVLNRHLEEARNLAIGARSMEELCEQRGKIRALLTLLSLPVSLANEQTRLLEKSAELDAELDREE